MVNAICAIGFYSMFCQLDKILENSIKEKSTPLILVENEKERFCMRDEDYEYRPQYENHWLYLSEDSEKLQKPKGLYMIHNKELLKFEGIVEE